MFLTALKSPVSAIALLMFKMGEKRNQIFKVRTLLTLYSAFHLKIDPSKILLSIVLSGFQSQNKTSKLTEVGFANLFNYC